MAAQNYRQQQRAEASTRLWQQWASGAISDEQLRAAHIAHGNSLGAYQHQDIGTRVNAVTSADFDQNFQPINENFPLATAGTYVVRTGDSLRSIAATVWGDAALWYLIAEANGMQGDEALTTDIRLTLPNVVTNIHNNANTHRPVDPGLTLGDTQPLLPEPPPPPKPKKKGCGAIGTIIVVVAIVVTWATAGWASTYVGEIAGWAIGGAAGSVASQGVGMAMGMQESFSWSSVATSAIAAGVTAGVGEAASTFSGAGGNAALKAFANPNSWVGAGMRATVSNVATQGISVAAGLQRKFDWRGVAAAGVGSAFGGAISGKMGDFADTVLGRTFTGLANGGMQSAIMGQSPNWGAIAANSFGSSVGDGIGKSAYNTIQRNAATKSLANENEERLRQQQDPEFWRKSQDAVSADVHERMAGSRVGVPIPEITQTQPSIDWSGLNGIDRSVAHQLEMAGALDAQASELAARDLSRQQFSRDAQAAANEITALKQQNNLRASIEWNNLPPSTGLDIDGFSIDAPYNPFKENSPKSAESNSLYESSKLIPGQNINLSTFATPEEINLAIKSALNIHPDSEIPLKMVLNENRIDRSSLSFLGDINIRPSQEALIFTSLTTPAEDVSDSGIDHYGESELRKISKKEGLAELLKFGLDVVHKTAEAKHQMELGQDLVNKFSIFRIRKDLGMWKFMIDKVLEMFGAEKICFNKSQQALSKPSLILMGSKGTG